MTGAIRIFKKDARHLWPVIATFLATLALFAINDPGNVRDHAQLLAVLLSVACGLLVVMAVHEEKLIGDQQYWLTRPFDRRELLLSKALFLVMFVQLPAFVCHAIVLATHGFNVGEHIGHLIAKQVFLAAMIVLPLAAIASVTKSLGRAILLAMLIALIALFFQGASVVFRGSESGWGGLSWIRASAVALVEGVASLAILWLQYRMRRNLRSMWILAVGVALVSALECAPPWHAAALLQGWLQERPMANSAVRIRFDSRLRLRAPENMGGVFAIPVQLDDVPPGLEVHADWIAVRAIRRGSWSGAVAIEQETAAAWLLVPNSFQDVGDRRVRFSGELFLTLLEGPDRTGSGPCVEFNLQYRCLTAGYAPYPTSPWFGPFETHYIPDLAGRDRLFAQRPVAHIERHFDFGELRLADYLVSGK